MAVIQVIEMRCRKGLHFCWWDVWHARHGKQALDLLGNIYSASAFILACHSNAEAFLQILALQTESLSSNFTLCGILGIT